MSIATGFDMRHEAIDDKPVNADYSAGLHVGGEGTVPHTSASRNVYALFVELNAPVVKNVELSAAVRFDHYSDVGSNTSPRVSGRWHGDASASRARFRRQGLPRSVAVGPAQPERVRQHGQRGRRPGLPGRADCRRGRALRGHPAQRAQHLEPQPQAPRPPRNGAPDSLSSRCARCRSRWTTGASRRRTEIGTVLADAILANPNDLTLYNRYISRFVRTPIGTTLYVDQPIENLGDLKTAGWDIDAHYRWDPGYGKFMVGFRERTGPSGSSSSARTSR